MHRLKVSGWKKIFHANYREKKAGGAVLVSDKIDFKTKKVTRDKEGHYIMIKGSVQQEDITILKYICTQYRSTSICEANTNRTKEGNRLQCIHCRRLQHTTHPKG